MGALVERLGGPTAAGKVLGTSPQSVVNWRNNRIPARFYKVHKARLATLGIEASDQLWDFVTEAELRLEPLRPAGAGRAGDPPL